MESNSKKKNVKKQSKFSLWFKWPLMVLIISFVLSMAFGVLSEVALSNASIVISIIVIVVFLVFSIVTDMIGVAVTAADMKFFRAMASRKVRGAKEAIMLKKNADKVSSIFADILGDICGILSGAAGATVTASLVRNSMSTILTIVIASLVSAVIAALIISGKSVMKRYSMIHSEQLILMLGKFLSFFHINKNKHSKNKKKSKKEEKIEEVKEEVKEENVNENESITNNIEDVKISEEDKAVGKEEDVSSEE